MPASLTPPPPLAAVDGGSSAAHATSSIVTVILIIASAIIVSASIYLLLRFLSKRYHHSLPDDDVVSRQNTNTNHQKQHRHVATGDLLDSLPLFTFRSAVAPDAAGGDCAVCLSRFQPHDRLRLLPLCCHAFHAACIDAWISSNQTCPLCRSTVLPSACDALDRILSDENRAKTDHGGSFRIEIGNISRRLRDGAPASPSPEVSRRSYSVGSFEYIINENGYEVSIDSTNHSRRFTDSTPVEKELTVRIQIPMPEPEPPGEGLAAEVSGGRSRLREYVDRLASISIPSRTASFRSSGRFFGGSSRRSEAAAVSDDLEAYTVGEEISELFRWLSGV